MTDLREQLRGLDLNDSPERWAEIVERAAALPRTTEAEARRRWPAALVAAAIAAAALGFGWVAFRPAPDRPFAEGLGGTITYAKVGSDFEGTWRQIDLASGVESGSPIDPDRAGRDLSPDGRLTVRFEQQGEGDSLTIVDISGSTDVVIDDLCCFGVVRDQVAWAPDSRSFVFLGQNADGDPFVSLYATRGEVTELRIPGRWDGIAWSPDARTLALVGRDRIGPYGLYLAPATGGAPMLVHEDDLLMPERIAWSPGSTSIATEAAESAGEQLPTDILVVAVDGTVDRLGRTGVTESSPIWSPSGAWIAFMSDREGRWEGTYRPRDPDIRGFGLYVMRENGDDVRPIIDPEDGVRWFAPIRWAE